MKLHFENFRKFIAEDKELLREFKTEDKEFEIYKNKINGKLICSQGGHKLTNQLLRRVFEDNANFSIVEVKEKNIPHFLINRNILKSTA